MQLKTLDPLPSSDFHCLPIWNQMSIQREPSPSALSSFSHHWYKPQQFILRLFFPPQEASKGDSNHMPHQLVQLKSLYTQKGDMDCLFCHARTIP
jgi:hypothetical protein